MSTEQITHDDLYNTIQSASFLREEEDGLVFALKNVPEIEQELLIDSMEFNQDRPLPSGGEEIEVLVERPWGKSYWSASYPGRHNSRTALGEGERPARHRRGRVCRR